MPLYTLARTNNVLEATARRYATVFADFFKAKKAGKSIHYHESGGSILRRVAELFAKANIRTGAVS